MPALSCRLYKRRNKNQIHIIESGSETILDERDIFGISDIVINGHSYSEASYPFDKENTSKFKKLTHDIEIHPSIEKFFNKKSRLNEFLNFLKENGIEHGDPYKFAKTLNDDEYEYYFIRHERAKKIKLTKEEKARVDKIINEAFEHVKETYPECFEGQNNKKS